MISGYNRGMHLTRFENRDQRFLLSAVVASWGGTCRRRRVGCVLVDNQKHIKATGYNGVPTGQEHCLDVPCPGAEAPMGERLEDCYATHAEINAFLQLQSYVAPLTLYCTVMPCRGCAKAISNTDVTRVVVMRRYPDVVAVDILQRAGIAVELILLDWDQVLSFIEDTRNYELI